MHHKFSNDIAHALPATGDILWCVAVHRYCTCYTAHRVLLRRFLHTRDHIPLCTSSTRFDRLTA